VDGIPVPAPRRRLALLETARRRGMASKYIPPMAVEAALLTLMALTLRIACHRRAAAGDRSCSTGWRGCRRLPWDCRTPPSPRSPGPSSAPRISPASPPTWASNRCNISSGIATSSAAENGRGWAACLKASNRHPSFQRVMLLASIVGSFLFGATVGTLIFSKFPALCLMLPVSFLGFIIGVDWFKPIADVKELDLLGDSELKVLGIVKSLLPPELGIWRISPRRNHKWHRAPDFLQWAEKIPARWRVVILALSPLTRFDNNAILDLESALKKLHDEGRKLILSGITHAQYRNLMDHGIGRSMDAENLCPDLEFAVARGIDLVQTINPNGASVEESVSSAVLSAEC
jgi:hypothetical protein